MLELKPIKYHLHWQIQIYYYIVKNTFQNVIIVFNMKKVRNIFHNLTNEIEIL